MKNLSIRLKTHIILIIVSCVVLCSAGIVIFSLNKAKYDADIVDALGKQRMLSQMMGKAVLGYVSNKKEFNIFENQIILLDRYITNMRFVYTENVLSSAEKMGMKASMHSDQEPHPTIPFPATFTNLINEKLAEDHKVKNDIFIDIVSESPINPEKRYKSKLDEKAGAFLRNNKDKMFSGTEEKDGKLFLLFYTPDMATVEACASCHSKMNGKVHQIGEILGLRKFKLLFSNDIAIGRERLNPKLDEYEKAKTVFAKTLAAVKLGGEYPLDLITEEYKTVKRINNDFAQEKIGQIENRFSQFIRTVDNLLSFDAGSDLFFQLGRNVLVQSNKLGKLSDDLVHIYTNISRKNHRNIFLAITLSGSVILFTVLSTAFYVTRAFSTPLKNLADAAIEVGKGKLETSIEVTSNDEIGQLSTSFNKMTGNLQSSRNELVAAKDYTDNIIRSMMDSLVVITPDVKIRTVNQAMCDLLGYQEHELVGQSVEKIFVAEDEFPFKVQDSLIINAFAKNMEMTFLSKEGKNIPVLFSGSVMRGTDGCIHGIVCMVKDIREEKKMREHLLRSEKLSSIGTFVSGVAHELNNPMTAVLGFSEILISRKDLPPEVIDDLYKVFESAKRCSNIVKNLLKFSSKHNPGKTCININEVISNTLALQEYRFQEHNIRINRYFEYDPASVMGDIDQLQQVFMNLILNAYDAIADSHKAGVVNISTKKDDDKVCMTFENDGPLIPKENLDKIFDPFFTTKGAGKGTGLGLSTSYDVIKSHNGRMWAENIHDSSREFEPGTGVRFLIELPLCPDAQIK